jgi:hypothetical protein|tara:strand:- start:318 stop:497 length:180 start_codon:yes stop_codon:yes gene_type:complete
MRMRTVKDFLSRGFLVVPVWLDNIAILFVVLLALILGTFLGACLQYEYNILELVGLIWE